MYKLKYVFLLFFFTLSGCNTYQVPMVANYQQIPVIHVQKNDTLYSLAKRYDTTAEDLAKHNGIEDPTALQPGTSLNVPRNALTQNKTSPTLSGKTAAKSSPTTSKQQDKLKSTAKTSKSPTTTASKTRGFATSATPAVKTKTANTQTAVQKTTAKKTPQKTATQTTKLKKPFVAKGTVAFAWPLKGKIISNYGGKGHGVKNDGINISAKKGTSVKAAESGIVVYAGNELKGYGNLILLKHEKNYMTAYAHADDLCVDVGDVVDKGQKIATVGQTGNVKTPQLHFEVRYRTKAVDPKKHLH